MSRVLVVEDESHLAQGLRFNLEAEGYSAEIVGDGEAATDRLLSKKENYDAIVLDNAIKYSGEDVDVRVRLNMPDEKRIVFSVQDRGIGIPPDDMKSIFKRFYRVNDRSLAHVKGTGLGLFIVKSIAQKHGGRVFAESAGEGQGTTITMELPRSLS